MQNVVGLKRISWLTTHFSHNSHISIVNEIPQWAFAGSQFCRHLLCQNESFDQSHCFILSICMISIVAVPCGSLIIQLGAAQGELFVYTEKKEHHPKDKAV